MNSVFASSASINSHKREGQRVDPLKRVDPLRSRRGSGIGHHGPTRQLTRLISSARRMRPAGCGCERTHGQTPRLTITPGRRHTHGGEKGREPDRSRGGAREPACRPTVTQPHRQNAAFRALGPASIPAREPPSAQDGPSRNTKAATGRAMFFSLSGPSASNATSSWSRT
jgi:hypothetical protein